MTQPNYTQPGQQDSPLDPNLVRDGVDAAGNFTEENLDAVPSGVKATQLEEKEAADDARLTNPFVDPR
jgi:hypothetical protein